MPVNPPRSGPTQQNRGYGTGSGSSTPGTAHGQRVGAVLFSLPVPVPAAGQPVNPAPFNIPDGYYLEAGPIPGNTNNAFFSTVSRQAAINGPREIVQSTQTFPRQIDVRNLADLWINATVNGEGVQFTVRKLV